MKKELYFSVDIEADGPYPGDYSMLSYGIACFSFEGKLLGTFTENLKPLEGAAQDEDTMKWWHTFPEVWKLATQNQQDPKDSMNRFVRWVNVMKKAEGDTPVTMIAYPAGFDFSFMYYYLSKFAIENPFRFQCLDIRTTASEILDVPYRYASKGYWPSRWKKTSVKHSHVALDDAIEQGEMFFNMKRDKKNAISTYA